MQTEAAKTHTKVCKCPSCTTQTEIPWSTVIKIWDAVIQKKWPDLWATLYPRRYQTINTYDTPKAVAYAMVDGIINYIDKNSQASSGDVTRRRAAEALWTATMCKYKIPIYYICYDLADALSKTTPPVATDWMEMKLPFDAAAFMIPKGIISHPTDGNIAFVGYTRNFAGSTTYLPIPTGKKFALNSVNDAFNIVARTDKGITLHWTLNEKYRMVDFKDDSALMGQLEVAKVSESYEKLNATDINIMEESAKMLFNILLFITSRPYTVEKGQLQKAVKNKRDKDAPRIEYWTPHFIGRDYKLKRPHTNLGGTHASPRGHWVSGHWREQPYGVQNKLHRSIWIEPFWKGGIASSTEEVK